MSAYTGIEIAIATDKEITLKEYLRDLCLNYNLDFSFEYLSSRIRNVGDTYIIQFREEIDGYQVSNTIEYAKELLEKYRCKIEIITESLETNTIEHCFYDGNKENSIEESYEIIPVTTDPYKVHDNYCHVKPFISRISGQAAKVFSCKPELYEKWCGFHHFTLVPHGSLFIGKGYANIQKYIDLEEYFKVIYPQEVSQGKGIRTGEDVLMEEYDDNGILIHHKNSQDESWWNGKGELIHTKTAFLEIYYEYDDKGKLIREYYPEGYEIKYEYNKKGLLIEENDSEGHRVINTYINGVLSEKTCFNPKGQVVYRIDTDGEEYWKGYDDNGQLICQVEIKQRKFYEYEHSYEDNNINFDLEVSNYRYDLNGNKILVGNNFYFFTNDSKNRSIYFYGAIHVYDDKDCLEYILSDSNKHIYDYEGCRKKEIEDTIDDYSSIYDRDGKLLYLYDDKSKEHKCFYESNTYIFRHLTEKELECLEYDGNDNLVRRVLFSDCSYYREYDNKNDLVQKIYRDGNQEWYDYDERGRLIHLRNLWGGEIKYEYDEYGNAVKYYMNEGGEFVKKKDSR